MKILLSQENVYKSENDLTIKYSNKFISHKIISHETKKSIFEPIFK